MALAVVSRNKWIQAELINAQESHRALIESQKHTLEVTVAERTQELREKHDALDEAHQHIVSSVNGLMADLLHLPRCGSQGMSSVVMCTGFHRNCTQDHLLSQSPIALAMVCPVQCSHCW
jgi:hypothetical protein